MDAVRMLLEYGFDVHEEDGRAGVVRLLLEHSDNDVHVSEYQRGYMDIVKLVVENGARW